jgi:hypothetical protein
MERDGEREMERSGLQRSAGNPQIDTDKEEADYSQVVDIMQSNCLSVFLEFHADVFEDKKGLHSRLLPCAAPNTNALMCLMLPMLSPPPPHYFIETL